MDVRMPRVDGIEATRRIVAADLPTRVLVLTTFDLDEHVYDALRAGAAGFLLKDVTAERLVAAVEDGRRGRRRWRAACCGASSTSSYAATPGPAVTGRVQDLSEREAEVFALIGAGMSTRRSPSTCSSRGDGEEPRAAHPRQARPARPRPGRGAGARERAGLGEPDAAWGGRWAAPVAALAHQASLGCVRPRGCSSCPCSPCGAGRRRPANRCTRCRTRSSPDEVYPCCRGTLSV